MSIFNSPSFVDPIASVGQMFLHAAQSDSHATGSITGRPLNLSGSVGGFLGKAMVRCFWRSLAFIISNIGILVNKKENSFSPAKSRAKDRDRNRTN
jgi:hypothetical protein